MSSTRTRRTRQASLLLALSACSDDGTPSEISNPPGEPFPPGVYSLEVSAVGTVGGQDFAVSNTFELTLTP